MLKNVRAEMMAEGVLGYEEVGNTAYVTFDDFTLSPERFGGYNESSAEPIDTVGLIIYAHSMITRENSPIENVVLDLSCNGGGAVDAAIYVVGWMLGYCDFHLTNPITNSFSTTSYAVDVNLDGEFNEKDTIADKNLYCLISSVSFSCGNLVPSLLKQSGMVTLLGDTSGGGACAVQFGSLADGSVFTISSSKRLSVVDNGAYYAVDRGVEPHIHLSKFESYFDRTGLTEYLNSLK
jgi:C-terminal processing protease CtpA/Prc